ncbi:YcxB family protein [Streptomyces sp. NPDC090057]|uniref:YcxB family protein n=1 Tax=Streptomyces sp. NPDC090057 TaxID=3365935 RepID=UPI0037F7082A
MVMDMGREAAQDAVELTYRPVVEDFTSALRARLRLSGRGRFQLWGPYVLGLLLVAEVIAVAAGADGVAPAPMAGLALGAVVMALAPWLQARQFVRLTERQGVFRTTVTDSGVTVATDTSTASITWAAQPRYAETARGFVLFSADKNATGFTMLPKHGLPAPADADRLRTILDRHLTRTTKPANATPPGHAAA